MRKRYHIITIGCQMNKSDSERVAAFFENHGYQTASDPRQADIIVLNTVVLDNQPRIGSMV